MNPRPSLPTLAPAPVVALEVGHWRHSGFTCGFSWGDRPSIKLYFLLLECSFILFILSYEKLGIWRYPLPLGPKSVSQIFHKNAGIDSWIAFGGKVALAPEIIKQQEVRLWKSWKLWNPTVSMRCLYNLYNLSMFFRAATCCIISALGTAYIRCFLIWHRDPDFLREFLVRTEIYWNFIPTSRPLGQVDSPSMMESWELTWAANWDWHVFFGNKMQFQKSVRWSLEVLCNWVMRAWPITWWSVENVIKYSFCHRSGGKKEHGSWITFSRPDGVNGLLVCSKLWAVQNWVRQVSRRHLQTSQERFYWGAGGAPLSNADLNFSGNAIEARSWRNMQHTFLKTYVSKHDPLTQWD